MSVLLVIITVLVAMPITFFAMARVWVNILRPHSIQGSDLHMLKWCIQEHTRAWAGFHITLTDDDQYEDLKVEIKTNITRDMQNPKSTYRRGVDLERKQYVFYPDHAPDTVLEDTEDDDEFFRLGDDQNRELIYRFHDRRKLIGALFDHTVWDGIRMFNETLVPAIKAKPFQSRWLLGDRYLPLISEVLMLYAVIRMAGRWITHTPLSVLPNPQDQRLLRHRLLKKEINSLKASADCKFTAALLARWSIRLFKALPLERTCLRVGLVVGMENPRFRNNYSVLILDVPRCEDPVFMAQSIQAQLKVRAIEVMPLYHLLSYVEMQTFFKKSMVDCLFSPGMLDRQEGPSQLIGDLFLYVVPTSMPIYTFACSLDEEIIISTTWNCETVSLEQLSSDAEALYERVGEDRIAPVFESAPQLRTVVS